MFPSLEKQRGKFKVEKPLRENSSESRTNQFSKFLWISGEKKEKGFSREMAEPSRNFEVEKLISYSDDLVKVLQDPRDLNNLSHCLQHTLSLSSSCHSDLIEVRSFLQDYQKKIDGCKQKIEEARSDTATDADLELLQRELEEELEKERSLKDEMVLSMYASVTNIVPNLDEQSKISGYIVEKDKDAVEKFEYDTTKMTALDICNAIWKIISE
ncbi:hypothetical protein CR513_30217, partial [Mucuna pruriens]